MGDAISIIIHIESAEGHARPRGEKENAEIDSFVETVLSKYYKFRLAPRNYGDPAWHRTYLSSLHDKIRYYTLGRERDIAVGRYDKHEEILYQADIRLIRLEIEFAEARHVKLALAKTDRLENDGQVGGHCCWAGIQASDVPCAHAP